MLTALGSLFGCYVPLFLLALAAYIYKIFHEHRIGVDREIDGRFLLTFFLVSSGSGVLCYFCFKAGAALRSGRRWAAYVATAFGVLLLLFGWDCLRYVYLPYAPGVVHGEDLFAFLAAIPCIGVGLWWCVYLNLPHVRRHLNYIAVAEPPSTA